MLIQKFDNVLSKFYLEDLQKAVFSADYTWVHHEETAGGYNGNYSWVEDDNTEETDLFAHRAPRNANENMITYDPLIYTVADLMDYRVELERIKINLMLPKSKLNPNSYNRPHVDYPEPGMKTFLFYLNDADGDTVIFDKIFTGEDPGKLTVVERITPKANSAVLFDSYRYHASSTPTLNKRSVINLVFWDPKSRKQAFDEQQKKMNLPFAPLPDSFSGTSHIKEFFNKK